MTPIIINCIALCAFSIGTYAIWFDRKNVFNHMLIGFCIVGYIIPCLLVDFDFIVSKEILNLYIKINTIGMVLYMAGLYCGYKWKTVPIVDVVIKFSKFEIATYDENFKNRIVKTSTKIFIASLITMALCFIAMGYIPMFASDPYSAKQFKGIYQPSYQRVALFYRTAKQFVGLLLPFLAIDVYVNKTVKSTLLVGIGIVMIFITMSRGEAISGLLVASSVIIALKGNRKIFLAYILFLVIVFSLGSSLWTILSIFFPNSGFAAGWEDLSPFEAIAAGAPDISDQLGLLTSFVNNHVGYTYGLTFFGGLVPFNFKWNPSVWSIAILNQNDDISEIASGGLRASVSLWGYFSFGWLGVVLVPFISAFFTGYIIKKIKNIVNKLKADFNGMIVFCFLVFIYNNIALVYINFFNLSIYSLPAFIFYAYIFYSKKKQLT
ncbi:oligosaccharide repeat unit polymerase [Mucilaginibacter sp. JRF]|uniref:O-antigen polymerase n=1 Tax=Mucilaginibacter sp. JRF TaxID=2780088 RepID=UPI00188111C1|nr:O-antigen polymerase [Mucilaginibacter sp. JRF]MBE9585157.1 oligosaccharide repeat unit polymerase [Mucilaginibacter sp. JRF]